MQALNARYDVMNSLSISFYEDVIKMYTEIRKLRNTMDSLGLFWIGEANDTYFSRLTRELVEIEAITIKILGMNTILNEALSEYMHSELMISNRINEVNV